MFARTSGGAATNARLSERVAVLSATSLGSISEAAYRATIVVLTHRGQVDAGDMTGVARLATC
jgi:hypothetical protein